MSIRIPPTPLRRHHRITRLARWPLLLAASAGALAAASCTDAPSAPRDRATGAITGTTDVLRDQSIDQSDSYLLTDAVTTSTTTVSSSTPFVDPATGRTVTSITLPTLVDSVHAEAGYDDAGTIRVGEWRSGSDRGTPAVRTQVVGDSVLEYDASGAVIPDSISPYLRDAVGGTFTDLVVTDSAILPPTKETAPPDTATGPGATPISRVRPPGVVAASLAAIPASVRATAEAQVRRPQPDQLEIVRSLDDPAAGVRGTYLRAFHWDGRAWAIAEERTEREQAAGAITMRLEESTIYTHVRWHEDRARNAARRARRAARGASSGAPGRGVGTPGQAATTRLATLGRPLLPAPIAATRPGPAPRGLGAASAVVLSCNDDCGTTTTGSGPTTGSTGTTSGTTTTSSGIDIIYAHGAFSDGGTWSRIGSAVDASLPGGLRFTPYLQWQKAITDQARDLRGIMQSSGGKQFIIVGHSNGALVARRAGQLSAAAGDGMVRGVVAIAGGHQGIPLALVARQSVSDLLDGQLRGIINAIGGSCWRMQFSWVCDRATQEINDLVPRIVNYALDATVPMARDVAPHSAFLDSLNAAPDPFPHYSIEVSSRGAWKFVRMLGDFVCDPEQSCSGDHLQRLAERFYTVLRTCGSSELAKAALPDLASKCRGVRWQLSALNQLYEHLVAPGDDSDGLVPLKSQAYPSTDTAHRMQMLHARTSHVGETRNATVRDDVVKALRGMLGLTA